MQHCIVIEAGSEADQLSGIDVRGNFLCEWNQTGVLFTGTAVPQLNRVGFTFQVRILNSACNASRHGLNCMAAWRPECGATPLEKPLPCLVSMAHDDVGPCDWLQAADPNHHVGAQLLANHVTSGQAVEGVKISCETWCGGFQPGSDGGVINGDFQVRALPCLWGLWVTLSR